jgi:bifunctional non-homologous end joining protein LigD
VAGAGLDEYRRKRRSAATPEPGVARDRARKGARRRGEAPVFVVQRHAARSLHYDLRLERNGALASWAVPKGVPLEPGQKQLAVHVEDHPLEYGDFEGEIPKGQYGAGTVEIWDRGTYELVEEKPDGGLTVQLQGERLVGTWTLVPASLDGKPRNWLLIRKQEGAPPSSRERYRPMLATPAESVPAGGDWLYEVKWDGYRTLAYVRAGEVELRSRNDKVLTERFARIAREAGRAVRTPDCVLDGEVVALDADGKPTFSAMQQGSDRLLYYVFDLLEADGESLLELPLAERRRQLERLLEADNAAVRLSAAFEDGVVLYEQASRQGFEGIIAKRQGSPYRPGERTREWLKVKTRNEDEFVVVGYTRGQGRRASSFGSLVLATRERSRLRWVGNVGTGFTERTIGDLLARLRPLERADSPLAETPKMPRVRKADVVWVEPELVAQVEFAELTHDRHLRAPSFVGLRDDRTAAEVRLRDPVPAELRKGRRVLKLSNLDKVFWPEEGITKGDLLGYYRDVAPVLVPHLKRRPFTMKRYPDGIEGKHFFQKDAPSHMPSWISTAPVDVSTRESPRRRRRIRVPLVDDELALLWMVNMGCVDCNTWYSRIERPGRPDFVLFDLDPSPDVGFREVVQVALLVKDALDSLGLRSFPKTSGADGFHVLVPITRRAGYEQTREFSEIVARALASTHRGLVTTEWSKAKRRGVLIDANQNGEGKTIASPYSVRPRPGAPVSTPLRWEEVDESLDPSAFTMEVVPTRVAEHGDLFAPVLSGGQSLAGALRALR